MSIDNQDTIFLTDLRVRTIIGINDWERRVRQTVSIDLLMPTDAGAAAASDSIDDTLNYKAVAKRLVSFVGESKFHLVESMAEHIAGIVLREFGAPWVRVSVHKPGAVRGSRDVGITIQRGETGAGARRDVYVGVGSNVEAQANLRLALQELEKRFGALRRSTVYRNPAVNFEGDDFLNMVVGFETGKSIEAVCAALARIEKKARRQRTAERNGPRTLDLDLLLFGGQVIDNAEFTVPHGDLMEFAFALRPLAELAGPVIHPTAGCSLSELWQRSDLHDHPMTPVDIS